MKYEYMDGFKFDAADDLSICTTIWKSMKFRLYDTLEEWMSGNSYVLSQIFEEPFRGDTPEHIVEDMLARGVLKSVQ